MLCINRLGRTLKNVICAMGRTSCFSVWWCLFEWSLLLNRVSIIYDSQYTGRYNIYDAFIDKFMKLPFVPFKSQSSILPLEEIACVPLIGRHYSKIRFEKKTKNKSTQKTNRIFEWCWPIREPRGTDAITFSGRMLDWLFNGTNGIFWI